EMYNDIKAEPFDGKFIMSVEDTDDKRNVEGGEESQLHFLKWLGIEWDESVDIGGDYAPYRKTERLDLYQKNIDELLEKNLAYECHMKEDELEEEREVQRQKREWLKYYGAQRDLTEKKKET